MALSSPWSYRFISLTPEQVQERRELLDRRGNYAQLSALALILIMNAYQLIKRTSEKDSGAKLGSEGLSSSLARKEIVQRTTRKSRSWLNSPPVAGWSETRKQYLTIFAWLLWLLILSSWRTGDDYLHLTKSLAHTAFSSIPIQVALSPKLSPSNPISRLISFPQSTLTPYHRLLGRLVICPLLTLHAALYLTFFILQTDPIPLLPRRLRDADVQLGITGITLVGVLWIMASSTALGLRKRIARQKFYVAHVALVMAMLAVAYFHVIYARKFVMEALTVYVVDIAVYLQWEKKLRGINQKRQNHIEG